MLADAALTMGSRTPIGAAARIAGKGLLALGTDTAKGAAAYPEELRASVSKLVDDAGIDKMDADAVSAWLKENPDAMNDAQARAMQAAFAATFGGTLGKRAGRKVGGAFGEAEGALAGEVAKKIGTEILAPEQAEN